MLTKDGPGPAVQLDYWRDRELDDAYLLKARMGRFTWEPHVHEEMMVAVSEAGVGECRTRQGAQVSGPGTFWVFAPGEYHAGRVEAGRHWAYRGVYLSAASIRSVAAGFDADRPRELFVPPGLYHDPQLACTLLHVHRRTERAGALLERQSQWSLALGSLFDRYGRPKPSVEPRDAGGRRLALARDYLEAHFREDVSIDDLARLCGVSRYHFMRSFRNAYGLPPHAFLNQLRLNAARRALAAGVSPAAAAADAGFYDQSVLNRRFKRMFGVTPGRYAQLAKR